MEPAVQTLIDRINADPAFARDFFADPDAHLLHLPISPDTRDALRHLDADAVRWMAVAGDQEPAAEQEYPTQAPVARWVTVALGFWLCMAYVVVWLVVGGAP